jgi:hypothetical protein
VTSSSNGEPPLPLPRHGEGGAATASQLQTQSESELLYDWRFTANRFVSATRPLRITTSKFFLTEYLLSYSLHNVLSDERTGLTFTIGAGLASAVILRSESRGAHDHILLSQIQDSSNLEGQAPVFISPGSRVSHLYPQVLGSLFFASYDP